MKKRKKVNNKQNMKRLINEFKSLIDKSEAHLTEEDDFCIYKRPSYPDMNWTSHHACNVFIFFCINSIKLEHENELDKADLCRNAAKAILEDYCIIYDAHSIISGFKQ